MVRVTREVSQMFGPRWGIAGFYCHHWPVRAVERFTGPWNSKLSNPILVIGNEADPVTPFRSAKAVADALGDSAILIEQDDYGHLSLAMHSDCTFSIVENYFLNNQLPTADQFCGTNQVLFPGPGVTKGSLGGKGNPDSLQTQLDEARARASQLTGAAIALACAIALLLLWFVGSWLRRRKGGSSSKDVVYWGKEGLKDEPGQGHVYSTPYDGPKALKLGGYTQVKT
ncbi:hypothetical protein FRC12_012378 [Ceratobasidium sp. 428]|nr:hypothetical protein FRC12_012378 [Ceratobasidium sp. 428]